MDVEVNGILAHELKAPLAVLRQLAFSLGELSPKNEATRERMISVSERAIKQVNDLSKISRLEDGLFVMEPVVVRAVCDDVSRELKQLFAANKKSFCVVYKNKSRLVVANKELLHSVIYNFLLNAMYYSENNSKSVLTVNERKGKIKISIRDYGPALPYNVWRKIKHSSVDEPLPIAMRPGSSGLGLYIASKFSHYMNANVGAVRHRDGASFYVEVPISRQASLFGG